MNDVNIPVLSNEMLFIPDAVPEKLTDSYDERNNLYVRNAVFSVEAYLAYLDVLSLHIQRDPARPYSYLLRLGYIPLIMPPSFWVREVMSLSRNFPEELKYVALNPISLVGRRYMSDTRDLWASKLDISELWGWKPEEVTVRRVFEQCGIR